MSASQREPFPAREIAAFVLRTPRYVRLSWHLARDPGIPPIRRAAVLFAAAYVLSPVDGVPGFIPILGQLDDLAVTVAALTFALAGLEPDHRRAHLESAGLSERDYQADMMALGTSVGWLSRTAASLAGRAIVRIARFRGPGPATENGSARL